MIGYIVFFIVFFIINAQHCSQSKKINHAIILIVVFSGLRYNIGFDYLTYWGDIEYENYSMEPLSGLLQLIAHETHPVFFFIITSLIMYPIMIKSFTQDSINPMESILFFICFQSFYICSLSTVRQAVAWSIIWWLIFQKDKGLFKVIITSIIAACFHLSGFIGILLLLPWHKLNKKAMLILFFFSVFGSYFISFLVSIISSDAMVFRKFAYYIEDESIGATKMKYLIWLIYLCVVLNYSKLIKVNDRYHYYISIVTLGVCLYNATLFSPHVSDRLMAMFWSTLICIMPALRKTMRISKPIFTISCILLFTYSILLAASSSRISGVIQNTYYPYRTFIETDNLGKGAMNNYE